MIAVAILLAGGSEKDLVGNLAPGMAYAQVKQLDEETLLKHSGLGTKLIRLGTDQLGADMTIAYEKGLSYTLRIKDV